MSSNMVFIVDDDAGVRTSLSILLGTAGIASRSFASAEDFLQVCTAQTLGCLLLDVRMQGMSGPQLQEELARRAIALPIIFLTGHAELEQAVGAMRAGAIDFLSKPVSGALLLQRVQGALAALAGQQQARALRSAMDARLARLTQRERQVLALTVEGLSNKEIAAALDISARTIEGHRARIYLKTGVTSVLQLVQLASRSGMGLLDLLTLANTASA
jgi:FixJ family two-component response regulator